MFGTAIPDNQQSTRQQSTNQQLTGALSSFIPLSPALFRVSSASFRIPAGVLGK
jgi:hypothetical protein